MGEFNSIELVTKDIQRRMNQINSSTKRILLLYAFNSTGKTRISTILNNEIEEKNILCYNAFIEDLFFWDNEEFIFHINPKSWIVNFIKEQGIDNEIIDNFKELVNSKVEPSFNLEDGEIIFNNATGDSDSEKGIKISRAEESIFIWSIFYTILSSAIENLNMDKEDRTTNEFDLLEYIIIDDPVSSIDDTKIITMAVKLSEIIKKYHGNKKLKFLITTHHALFYNVLYNIFRKKTFFESLILMKNEKIYELKEQNCDSPFGYHLVIKGQIEKAIEENKLQKYHFNLFRNLIEKTSNFLGYKEWGDCITCTNKNEFLRVINLYSHSRLSDLEYSELPDEDKKIFIHTYNDFIKEFKWGQNNE